MNKEILEIDDLSFTMKLLKTRQSLALAKQQDKLDFFAFVENFIETVTTLDSRQISEMKVQVAISIMVYYRFYFWDNESVSDEPLLTPKDFLGSENYKEEIIKIGDYRFNNIVTLSQMKKAERLCYLNGDAEYMNFYLMSAFCLKGLKAGVDTLLDEGFDNGDSRVKLKLLNSNIGDIGNIKMDFLQSSEKLGIVSNSNYIIFLSESSFFLGSVFKNI